MDYSIKNVKTFPGHDGMLGFNASLYKGSKKIATVFDSAHGGCYEYTWVNGWNGTDAKELEEHIKTLPDEKFGRHSLSMDMDLFVGKMVDEFETKKRLKRYCRTKTLYRIDTTKEGVWQIGNIRYSEDVLKKLKERYGKRLVAVLDTKAEEVKL